MSILVGLGDGTLGVAREVSVGRRPVTVALGDFNGDGRQDFAAANNEGNSVTVRLNQPDGTFRGPAGLVRGDFLTDGRAVLLIERFLIPFPAQHDGDQLRVSLAVGTGPGA